MPSLTHILETTALVLVAYVLGCAIGYAVHRILYAARGTHKATLITASVPVATAPAVTRTRRSMTPAARLAGAVSDEPVSPPAIVPTARKTPAKAPAPRPAAMSKPRADGADNLKQIKGIGPKLETALNDLGVFHLDQIAGWSKANIDWVDKQLVLRGRITRERWVEQASTFSSVTRLSA